MVSALIRSRLVNLASCPALVQYFELIMALAENYILEERVVKIITGELFLNLSHKNIEKVFHLLRED